MNKARPHAVLFACGMNAVRSPMAAGLMHQMVGNSVFVGSADGRLYRLGLKDGEQQWSFEAGGAIVASPAVADGRLVIGNDSGQLYCFGAK